MKGVKTSCQVTPNPNSPRRGEPYDESPEYPLLLFARPGTVRGIAFSLGQTDSPVWNNYINRRVFTQGSANDVTYLSTQVLHSGKSQLSQIAMLHTRGDQRHWNIPDMEKHIQFEVGHCMFTQYTESQLEYQQTDVALRHSRQCFNWPLHSVDPGPWWD